MNTARGISGEGNSFPTSRFPRFRPAPARWRVATSICYNALMITTLKNLLPDIESWPAEDQRELAEAARDIEARRQGLYRASREELEGIDAGLADLRHGRIA